MRKPYGLFILTKIIILANFKQENMQYIILKQVKTTDVKMYKFLIIRLKKKQNGEKKLRSFA